MFDGFEAKVDIQIRPVEMVGRTLLYIEYLGDGCVAEPREVLEGQEQLTVSATEPDAVSVYVRYFKVRHGRLTPAPP